MTAPAKSLDCRTLDVFLGRLRGSESSEHLDTAGHAGHSPADEAQRPPASSIVQPASGHRTTSSEAGYVQRPAVQPDRGNNMDELRLLVTEVADELDRHPVGTFIVTGEQVRSYYRAFAVRDLQGALASARHRYWMQCTGLVVLPLPATEGAL